MRNLFFVLLCTFAVPVNAEDSENWACIKSVHKKYVSSFQEYWDLIGTELEKRDPTLYQDFSYIISEQKNNVKMNQITLDHLIKKHRNELRMDGVVYNIAPVYRDYQKQIFRELMEIDEYRELFRTNREFEHVEKMPNFQHLQKVTLLINSVKNMSAIETKGEETLAIGQQAIIGLQCPVLNK